MHSDLSEKTAFVTGGSAGIGAATVRMLAEAINTVVVGYNKGEGRATSLVGSLPGGPHSLANYHGRQCLNQAGGGHDQETPRKAGHIGKLGFTKPIRTMTLMRSTMSSLTMLLANVQGPFSVIRELRPLLQVGSDSVIVNLSSVSGFGAGSNIAYCACKAAIDTMTLSLARALGPEIRVNTVSPGAVATDFVAGRDRAKLEELAKLSPLQEVVEPEDVAMAIMAYVTHLKKSTGAQMIVDSGRFL